MTTPDTKAIRAQYSDGEYLDAYPGEACATILALCDEVERLRRMLDLRGTGPAERYWEGRWRDEAAENERLRAALQPFADYMHTDEGRLDLDHDGCELPDDLGVGWIYLNHGDFRRAQAALAQKGDQP